MLVLRLFPDLRGFQRVLVVSFILFQGDHLIMAYFILTF
jgi:hypothetical protein